MSLKSIQSSHEKQRCNHCMAIFNADLTECPNCGREDGLMFPFTAHDGDWDFELEQLR